MESECVGKRSIQEQSEAPEIIPVLRLDSVPETKKSVLLILLYVSKIIP